MSYQVEHETIKSTISDYYSVLAEVPGIKTVPVPRDPKTNNGRD